MISTEPSQTSLLGVDFTSAPSKRKPITVARGVTAAGCLQAIEIIRCCDFGEFEALLRAPGPWLGAFDFPFGLPREGVTDLGWPLEWDALVTHCAQLGKAEFKRALDRYREGRPHGHRYPHRQTDQPARSHSPFKLVNPPVGLMFLEGSPRLLAADLSLPGLREGDRTRIALEAYPALIARRYTTDSYKSDERQKQTPTREARRCLIMAGLERDFSLACAEQIRRAAIADASGDTLDALIALVQASIALNAPDGRFGLPETIDPIEGWILGV